MSRGRKHALLSASSAHRWLACAPSARLEEQFPDLGSVHAKEGTLAHEICELKVSQKYIKPQPAATFKRKLKKLQENELYQKEMDGHTEEYLDYISAIMHSFGQTPYIAVEKQVDYSHAAPEGFGTCDCIIIGGDTMHIVDFKYGKGIRISAGGNPQLKLYAAGALKAYGMLYPIERIVMHIVQPRIDNNSQTELTVECLERWIKQIKPWAEQAYRGEGDFKPEDETCRFCRAGNACRARADKNLGLAEKEFKMPPFLSSDEVGEVLKKARDIKQWVDGLEEWALKEILRGGTVPGWKAVEGRSTRGFADQEKAFAILKGAGIDEALLYERKALSLASIEKLIGKKEFNELLSDQVVKPQGKPALALQEDKREAITLRTAAAEDFKEEK